MEDEGALWGVRLLGGGEGAWWGGGLGCLVGVEVAWWGLRMLSGG